MPFVRTRTTKARTLSTALVEAYRDAQGRPRQRLLANLHGEPTPLKALAKLIVMRDRLRGQLEELAAEHRQANDPRRRGELGERILQIDRQLKVIAKDGDAINPHCTATPKQLQAAMKAYSQELREAALTVLGMMMVHGGQQKKAKAAVRRLST